MPALGEQQFVVIVGFPVTGFNSGVTAPPAPMVKVSIWPLLDANRKLPSGVAASDMPWQPSSVSTVATGDPTRVSMPLAGLIENEVMVRSPVLATNSRLLIGLRVIRFRP
jgi:hypothetical protein